MPLVFQSFLFAFFGSLFVFIFFLLEKPGPFGQPEPAPSVEKVPSKFFLS